ncbi:DUF6056 family protein [Butyrivibrio sp. XBB1001]|uniref:DUF6056 family protein n=1 Tax=Butyrivibrio sp. XBB1001 TaxID=1280682 RepID=UPI0003FBD0F5|nr:DUF6056 family protein [Butyrivibrio sp. XBB1001]
MADITSRIKKIVGVVVAILTIVMMFSVVAGTLYTFPAEDDFSYECGGRDGAAEYKSSVIGSFYKTLNIYRVQQGCYTAMYLDHMVRPYNRGGLPAFHVAMLVYMVLFIFAVGFVLRTLIKDNTAFAIAMFAAMISCFGMTGSSGGTMIFYWYTGNVGYMLMFTLAMFTTGFFLRAIKNEGKKAILYLVLSSVFAFLASGGSLVITSINCSMLLAIIILASDKVRVSKILIIPFIFAMIGAFINVLAPGNFQRTQNDLNEGHETVVDAVRDTFQCYFIELKKIADPLMVTVMVIVITAGIILGVKVISKKVTWKLMLISIAGIFAMQYFTIFPAVFGYHRVQLTGHVTASYYIIARLLLIVLSLIFSQWIQDSALLEKTNNIGKMITIGVAAIAILFLIISPTCHSIYSDSFCARTYRDLRSGRFNEVLAIREYELTYFELAEEGSDAILYLQWDTGSESLPAMGIGSDCEWIVNRSAANLFKLHTTTVLIP